MLAPRPTRRPAETRAPLLEIDVLHRYPGGFQLEVKTRIRANCLAVFGPSGSGKSTLINILAGAISPERGRVTMGGRELLDRSVEIDVPPERRRIGWVHQEGMLFPHLNVHSNLIFGHTRRGRRRTGATGSGITYDAVVDLLHLDPLLDRSISALSGGERRRVALGRALLADPLWLLMDEPLASLDNALRERILPYLERIREEFRIPLVYVSHSQEEVRRLADHVLVLDRGRLAGEGHPEEALTGPAVYGTFEASVKNLIPMSDVRGTGERLLGRINDTWLVLPDQGLHAAHRLWVAFGAKDVVLAREHEEGHTTIRNRIPGVVTEIFLRGRTALVAVDVGERIWAEITHEAVEDLDLRVGERILCLIKTRALKIVD
jgi:molybdate transport system ATP-binding protein